MTTTTLLFVRPVSILLTSMKINWSVSGWPQLRARMQIMERMLPLLTGIVVNEQLAEFFLLSLYQFYSFFSRCALYGCLLVMQPLYMLPPQIRMKEKIKIRTYRLIFIRQHIIG